MDTTTLRRWATPMTIGAFMLISITGIMMFFHIELGIIKVAHEWLSWLMLLAVGLHVVVNWRAFSRYFSQKPAVAVIGVFALLLLAAMLIQGDERRGPQGRGGPMQAAQVLLTAPLDKVADITGNTPNGLRAKLQEKGFAVDAAATSLDAIAKQNQRNPMEVLNGVMGAQ